MNMDLIEEILKNKQDLDKWEAIANLLGLTVGTTNETRIVIRKSESLIAIYKNGSIDISDIKLSDDEILNLLKKLKNRGTTNEQ